MSKAAIVVTTIQQETDSLRSFRIQAEAGFSLVIVGDVKTPPDGWDDYPEFLDYSRQNQLGFRLAEMLPTNHYSRKNLGYLYAMRKGFDCIYDTDDDNAPMANWTSRSQSIKAQRVSRAPWLNAYALFGESGVWPRGLPLEFLRSANEGIVERAAETCEAPIQQGLANGSPDVDAIWRLVSERQIEFAVRAPITLDAGTWCPFNSQSTWWFREAFPLIYLPSFVTFRMTDIWRSFVAQRCLWEIDRGIAFVGPEVFQDRNEHNLLRDFEQEIPGYLNNERIRVCLESLSLDRGPTAIFGNFRACYGALVEAGFVPESEMDLVDAWLSDLQTIRSSQHCG